MYVYVCTCTYTPTRTQTIYAYIEYTRMHHIRKSAHVQKKIYCAHARAPAELKTPAPKAHSRRPELGDASPQSPCCPQSSCDVGPEIESHPARTHGSGGGSVNTDAAGARPDQPRGRIYTCTHTHTPTERQTSRQCQHGDELVCGWEVKTV